MYKKMPAEDVAKSFDEVYSGFVACTWTEKMADVKTNATNL